MNFFWKVQASAAALGFMNLALYCYRTAREERSYDGVPKFIIYRTKEINAGMIPSDMKAALSQWLPEGEQYTLKAEAIPILQEHEKAPTWCIRVSAQGDGIDSGFDALFNRRGEILT